MRRGPKHKMCRRVGASLCGRANCPAQNRPYPAGSHGNRRRRRRQSEYEVRLLEKQKLRAIYALREKQFRRYVDKATRKGGETGENLLAILECRLDNVVRRMGYARTIHEARQIVSHRHVVVNGRRVSIPSHILRPGDKIQIIPKDFQPVQEALQEGLNVAPYVTRNEDELTGELIKVPERGEIPQPVEINDRLVVEFYSR